VTGADFRGAKLFWLDDRHPKMTGAILAGADFSGATIEPDLPDDAYYCKTVLPNGEVRNSGCDPQTKQIVEGLRRAHLLPE